MDCAKRCRSSVLLAILLACALIVVTSGRVSSMRWGKMLTTAVRSIYPLSLSERLSRSVSTVNYSTSPSIGWSVTFFDA